MSEPSITLTVPGAEPAAASRQLPDFIAGPRRELRRTRAIIAGVLLLALLLAIGRLSLVTGWWRVARVDGPSMAESYFGAHYRVRCRDCGILFRCDAEHPPADMRVVCPNCGYRKNTLQQTDFRPGDRVLIDRWPTLGRAPHRGAVVALQDESTGEFFIKRTVALPGEQWGIRHGDLYINDQISRKGLHQLLQQRVLVHDHNYQPERTRGLPLRWQGEESSNWRREGKGFVFEPSTRGQEVGRKDPFNWLTYTHWACTAALRERTQSSPVFDNDAYNQALSRNLNWAADIMLSCRIECQPDSRFALLAKDEPHHFEIVFDRAKSSVVLVDLESGDEVARSNERAFADSNALDITVALCDQQVLVAEGMQTLITYQYPRLEPCETPQPFAIGGQRGRIKVTNLRVYRDIYYLHPDGTNRAWQAPAPLAPGQIAVLGDNPPASIDSRNQEQGLPLRQVKGVVYRPFWISSP